MHSCIQVQESVPRSTHGRRKREIGTLAGSLRSVSGMGGDSVTELRS
jgi:hypothetical protein